MFFSFSSGRYSIDWFKLLRFSVVVKPVSKLVLDSRSDRVGKLSLMSFGGDTSVSGRGSICFLYVSGPRECVPRFVRVEDEEDLRGLVR